MRSALMTAEAAGLIPDTGIDEKDQNVFGVGRFEVGRIEHGATHLISIEPLDRTTTFRFIVDRGTASGIVEEWGKLFSAGDGN